MSGETGTAISGWTVDTLRESLTQQLVMQRDALRQQLLDDRDALTAKIVDGREYARLQFADQQQSLQRQFGDLQTAHRQQVADMRALLDERYATQTKALDAAFKAAEQAVAVALANAEKATGKAETAAERRFESVNEFRKALTDQTATFLPRAEYDTAHIALADRITATGDRVAALELRLTSRLDRGDGADIGTAASRTDRRLDTGQFLQVLVVIVAVAAVIIAVFKG